jgi:hypothetical protein
MARKRRNLDDRRHTLHRRPHALDIFLVLPASRIRTEGRSRKRHRMLDPVGAHLPDRIRQHRMPIAVAPIHRNRKPLAQRGHQRAILIVQGAAAVEVIIMLGHLEQALARHIASAQHVF